jgi:PadR family transcriptional regulator
MTGKKEWPQGSIEPLLLTMVFDRAMYGYQIIHELETRSDGYFKIKEGTLYPVLHRLEGEGYIVGEWKSLDNGRQRKYYHITRKGRAYLAVKRAEWRQLLAAVTMLTRIPLLDME